MFWYRQIGWRGLRQTSLLLKESRSLYCPFKMAEHSFQVPMPNSPLLLNYLCFGAVFCKSSSLTPEGFDRSFTWFLNYLLVKFLELLTTGSLEIGKFLRKQSNDLFKKEPFGADFSVNHADNDVSWSSYRLSLPQMRSTANQSTHFRAISNFPTEVLQYTDYARAKLKGLDIRHPGFTCRM